MPAPRALTVLVVAGARPNFMKVAPILRALKAAGHRAVLVHTGQHYDVRMSDTFFQDLGLPEPDHHLEVGSASHAVQTARCMEAFEPVLKGVRPDWVVVVGDVNSTLACALVASKLAEEVGCRIAHVEAGLRSHDWRMPEEVNRVLTDRLSDLCMTPSEDAAPNLRLEGIPEERIVFVGNVMIDTLFDQLPAARELDMPGQLGVEPGNYAVVTLHRPSNVDDPQALANVLQGLGQVARTMPVVFPIHPRTRKQVDTYGLDGFLGPLTVVEPLGYRQMLGLVADSAMVLSDSGGLQEETSVLGVPCVTLREQTERPSTLIHGTNAMIEWPITVEGIMAACAEAPARRRDPGMGMPDWDGKAAVRVVAGLEGASQSGLFVAGA